MPGSGTIGGGKSCKIELKITDANGVAKNPSKDIDEEDTDVSYPFYLGFRFPAGTTMQGNIVMVPILSKDDKVSIFWK